MNPHVKMNATKRVRQRTWAVVLPRDRERLLDLWKEEKSFVYLYGQWEKSDKGFEHLQAVLGVKEAIDERSIRQRYQLKTIQPVSDKAALAAYITKRSTATEEKPVEIGTMPQHCEMKRLLSAARARDDESGDEEDRGKKREKRKDSKNDTIIREALELESVEEALKYCKEKMGPMSWIRNEASLTRFFETEMGIGDPSLYDISSYNVPPLLLPRGTTTVLVGETGFGKTMYALAHFERPLHFKEQNDWARLSPRIDGVVIDDVATHIWQPLSLLRLIESETTGTQNIKYGATRLKAFTPRILLTNGFQLIMSAMTHRVTRDAMIRRCKFYFVSSRLYGDRAKGTDIGIRPISEDQLKRIFDFYRDQRYNRFGSEEEYDTTKLTKKPFTLRDGKSMFDWDRIKSGIPKDEEIKASSQNNNCFTESGTKDEQISHFATSESDENTSTDEVEETGFYHACPNKEKCCIWQLHLICHGLVPDKH